MASNKAQTPRIVDSPEALEQRMAEMKQAQKIFATYTQEQVDHIFQLRGAGRQQGSGFPWPSWRWRRPAWAWWRTRSSRTTSPPSTSITTTRT